MAHPKDFDSQHSNVVMLQVEDETDLLCDFRDRSDIAEKKYSEAVSNDLLEHL